MRFAERVPTRNQRNGFIVVHRHSAKRLANIARRSDRVRAAVRSFRVHVNQTHLDRAQRMIELPIAFVTLVSQPLALRPPVNVLWALPKHPRGRRQNQTS